MDLIGGFVAYAILWWMVLFMVLPFGNRTYQEAGAEMEPGQAPSAPTRPRILLKFLITTVITSVIFGIVWALVRSGVIDFRQLIFGSP